MQPITNATVSSKRNGVTINSHVRVTIAGPRPENRTPDGVVVTTTMLAYPPTTWRTGDRVTFEVLDGFADLDQITMKEVQSAVRQPSSLLPPSIKVFLKGTIQ